MRNVVSGIASTRHDSPEWSVMKHGSVIAPDPLHEANSGWPEADQHTGRHAGYRVSKPVIRPLDPTPQRHFITTARWEGAVIERLHSYFTAEVVDLDSDERAMVDVDVEELTESDVPLCQPGALFYWSIGYDIGDDGQRSRSSVFWFRRLGPR